MTIRRLGAAHAQFFQRHMENRHSTDPFLDCIPPIDLRASTLYKYHPNYRLVARLNSVGVRITAVAKNKVTEGSFASAFNFSNFIPFGAGYPYEVSHRLTLGAESSVRHTFTGPIDERSTYAKANRTTVQGDALVKPLIDPSDYGNPKTDDWHVCRGFTVAYNFGHRPCYCNRDVEQRREKSLIY